MSYYLKRVLHRAFRKHFVPSLYYCRTCRKHVKQDHSEKQPAHVIRRFGAKLTKPKPEAYKRARRFLMLQPGDSLPSKVDYRPILEDGGFKVFDQGQQGSCTANAGCADKAFQEIVNKSYGGPFSRAFLYYEERALHGWQNEDNGAYMQDIGTILGTEGCCLDATMPYNQFDYTTPPSSAAKTEAAEWLANRDQTALHWGDELKAALVDGPIMVDGVPVGLPRIGVPIYSSFTQSEYNGGWVPVPAGNEELLGGHALLVVGYDDYLTGPDGNVGYYIVLNSWGTLQGAKGYQYFPYNYEVNTGPQSDNWQQFDETPGPGPGPNPPTPSNCEQECLDCMSAAMGDTDFWSLIIDGVTCIINYYTCALGISYSMTKKTSGKGDAKTLTLTFKKKAK